MLFRSTKKTTKTFTASSNGKTVTYTSLARSEKQRLMARCTDHNYEVISRAIEHTGMSMSQFVVDACLEKAKTVIEDYETLHLTLAGADAIMNALNNPSPPTEAALKAARLYRDSVNVNRR